MKEQFMRKSIYKQFAYGHESWSFNNKAGFMYL